MRARYLYRGNGGFRTHEPGERFRNERGMRAYWFQQFYRRNSIYNPRPSVCTYCGAQRP